MSNSPEIIPLFATPLVIYDVPDAAALNADLRKVIEQREKSLQHGCWCRGARSSRTADTRKPSGIRRSEEATGRSTSR